MVVLSNVEFEKLVAEQPPRLKTLAKQRCDVDPKGFVSTADLGEMAQIFSYSGDDRTAGWLKNLSVLAKNGKIQRLRKKTATWQDHVDHVIALQAADEIPFKIGDHIFVKDEGRYGSVVDYIPAAKEYLVVLDPFHVKQY